MKTRVKVFLSHASVDKALVGRVYRELGAGICHYDVATFDRSGSIAQEIYDALATSTHFVLFASPTALASSWVQGELKRAFDNWMHGSVQQAMVFLLDGARHEQVPDWLKHRVISEPPSWRHVVCRIQTEVDRANRPEQPPYFGSDISPLESRLLNVEASRLPGVILLHGPDGSGRKRVINELYARQYPNVLSRKILIPMSEFSTEVELYREIVGHTRIATISEFEDLFREFEELDADPRFGRLAEEIVKCSEANQCLIVDCDRSLLTDDARLPSWLLQLAHRLAGKDYPRLTVTTTRRPRDISVADVTGLLVQEIHALDRDSSQTLLNWWLRHLAGPFRDELKEVVFDACAGNPKQIELGAKALIEAGAGRIDKIRPELMKTLEGASRQILEIFETQMPHRAVLAFVANTGFPSRTELLVCFGDAGFASPQKLNEAIDDCASYGFLIEDEVCIWMPEYLQRGARAIGRDSEIAELLARVWMLQAERFRALKIDEFTSIPLLNEYCMAFLRDGANDGSIFDNILLASQCLRVARSMYDRKDYKGAIRLCELGFSKRGTLTEDAQIELLRYMGLGAARLNEQSKLQEVYERLNDFGKSDKAKRIRCFLMGFNARLDGDYDLAQTSLSEAYRHKGNHDLHILRELAFIALQSNDLPAARRYLSHFTERASTNPYALELAVRVELSASSAVVAKRRTEIDELMARLRSFDISSNKVYWHQMCCERLLALGEVDEAQDCLERPPLAGSESPVVVIARARIAMKRKSFAVANKILDELREKISSRSNGQRKSILPIVLRLLIESSSAADLEIGLERFLAYQGRLPKSIAQSLAKSLLDSLAFTGTTVPSTVRDRVKRISEGYF